MQATESIFFYILVLLSFLLIFNGANSIRLKEYDSFSKKHFRKYILMSLGILVFAEIVILFENDTIAPIFSVVAVLAIAFSTVSYKNEDLALKNISKTNSIKNIKNIPKRENKKTLSDEAASFEKRKIEDHILLALVPIIYAVAFMFPSVFAFSSESLVNSAVNMLVAVAIGIVFGLILLAIKRKHVVLLITVSTVMFILSESMTKMGLISVVMCAIVYHNIVNHNEIDFKEKHNEEKYIHRIISLFEIIAFLFLFAYFGIKFSIAALVITSMIISLRYLLKEQNFTVSLIPLSVLFCLGRIFPDIYSTIELAGTVAVYLMIVSTIINIKDISKRIRNIVKPE